MNPRVLVAFLAVVGSSGCVVYREGEGPPARNPARPGDVTFSWSFAGRTCADAPEVKSVVVEIEGEVLENDGVFPCTANNYPGIELHDFLPGSYRYSLTALGYGNEQLYVADGQLVVDGDVRVSRDLTPVGSPSSYGYLTWRFPPIGDASDPSCAAAGVAAVEVRIDGGRVMRAACADGFLQPGWQTPYLTPGTHALELTAVDATGYVLFAYSGTLTTRAFEPIASEYGLAWAVGGAALRWQFSNGLSCGANGTATVYVNFKDRQTGRWLYPQAQAVPCAASAVVYDALPPGTYDVDLTSNGSWASDPTAPISVNVIAGVFRGESDASTVMLYRY